MSIDQALEALADASRRDLFERIIVRPQRVGDLVDSVGVTRQAISRHLKILKDAGLVRQEDGRLHAVVEKLPELRMYFDRLWLEATLGDAWLLERRNGLSDLGL